ncbi:hypothetical protein CAPN010_16360 [Capnocytophaga cynodegmi]|uniref:LexA family transcriptional regulator n=1 Tax=Capnocytophaga cynodegmi TaxID=28189 RepID=UPI001EE1FA8A|nr:LexA family transcriptional regulator [Capnocytophaga cynodegmi]GJQ07478.1 hypothetical protein CAPN010_16360 [Capnocytophaga cynodegmi]
MTENKRLKVLQKELGFSNQTDFANVLGIKQGSLSDIYREKNGIGVSDSIKMILIKDYSINIDWLKTGKGEMFDNKKIPHKNTVTPVPEEDYMMVEYVDLATNAGTFGGGIVADLDEIHTRLVPREYDKGLYLVVRVSGNSMDDGTKKSLSDGDEVLVRLWQENIQYLPIKMKLFVVNTNEGSVIKQISNIDYAEKTLTLHSFNEEYEDYKLHFDDVVQIFTVEKIVNSKIRF